MAEAGIAKIEHRPLTAAEARQVHHALKETPNILGYTVRELTRFSDVYVAEVEQEFAGVCISKNLAQNWTETAALCVLPEFRGCGIGRALFQAAWARAQERRRHVYVLSRNLQVIEWMRECDMSIDGRHWQAPPAVQWDTARHMASWYRATEGFRKRRAIGQCPPLVQGVKKYAPPP